MRHLLINVVNANDILFGINRSIQITHILHCCRHPDFWCRHIISSHDTDSVTNTWWRLQKETFSALLALCEENLPVTGGFPSQSPVTRSFDVFFPERLIEQTIEMLWLETPSRSLWIHCNEIVIFRLPCIITVTSHERHYVSNPAFCSTTCSS